MVWKAIAVAHVPCEDDVSATRDGGSKVLTSTELHVTDAIAVRQDQARLTHQPQQLSADNKTSQYTL